MPLNPPPKPHILCVDDEPQVLESLKLNLRRAHTVSTATGGAEALALLDQASDIAVIVSDMRMPGMNGAAFLAQARHKAPDAVRMLLTGQSDPPTRGLVFHDAWACAPERSSPDAPARTSAPSRLGTRRASDIEIASPGRARTPRSGNSCRSAGPLSATSTMSFTL